jgi:hypothetical protein
VICADNAPPNECSSLCWYSSFPPYMNGTNMYTLSEYFGIPPASLIYVHYRSLVNTTENDSNQYY